MTKRIAKKYRERAWRLWKAEPTGELTFMEALRKCGLKGNRNRNMAARLLRTRRNEERRSEG